MNNLNSSLEVLFNNLDNILSTKTVVGEPTVVGDVIIVPLVDVSVGVGAGGREEETSKFGGGGGLGARITPSAIIVIQDGSVQLVNIKDQNSINKIIDMVPGIVSKFNLDSIFKSGDSNSDNDEDNLSF